MKIKKHIGIRLNRQRLETLFHLYDWLISVYEWENESEFLLFAHLTAMYRRLQLMLQKQFATMKLDFSEPEAVAFCMTWTAWNLDHDTHGKIVARDLVAKIDKERSRINARK